VSSSCHPTGINESAYIHATDTSHISSHLLASKSNYQCIIEGKNSELGLSYPDQLLTNLIAKRTCHSVAERGRRNRMNKALQDMAKLLPRDSGTDGANDNSATNSRAVGINGSGSGSVSGRTGDQINSKASTVEMAIEYIKSLQKELMEMKSALEERRPQ
jgi:Helix-loop-helix DNA-binding domain